MSGLSCHSCGGNNIPDGSASYIGCQYCGASISVTAFFNNNSSSVLSGVVVEGLTDEEAKSVARLFDDAEKYVRVGEYDSAKCNFEEILKLHPKHTPSRLSLANCIIFDEKIPALERAAKVKNYIQNSNEKYQDIPEILAIKESLVFNLASMGEKLTNGMDALKLIQISEELQTIHQERDALAQRFFGTLSSKVDGRVRAGFLDSGKKYSPTQNDIEIMVVGSRYSAPLANLCATMLYHFKKNKDSIHHKSLSSQERIASAAERAEEQVPIFNSSLFSGMKETMLSKKEVLNG